MVKKEVEKLLKKVQKPARYTGGELNSVVKNKEDIKLRYAFCFPDNYEIGMSHLGMKILYSQFNSRDDVWCERVFAPWTDFEAVMRENNLPLFALESRDPISEFDIIGFTLQYEMSYTNVLNMLELGGIPVRSADRKGLTPLVCAGGPCCCNPEPLADFIDLFFLGEGEEVDLQIIDLYKKYKDSGDKEAFLREAAKIQGVYVPSLYNVEYKSDGTIEEITPISDAPKTVKKRIISDLDNCFYPTNFITPYIEIVHDRVMQEIFRGCIRGCRFCQAGYIYRPVREKSVDTINRQAKALCESTGYDEISLSSLSTSDYTNIEPLLNSMLDWCNKDNISVALPSLRIDNFSEELLEKISAIRKSGLTFAPEAGTQRLRDVINKNITEDEILNTCITAFNGGYTAVKLYFMLGLPTETEDDLKGIIALGQKIVDAFYSMPNKPKGKSVNVSISVSTFVPKPFTPFQYEPQDNLDVIKQKQSLLKDTVSSRKISLSYHDSSTSFLEGVLARGDRRLCNVIERAWKSGCKFDSWSECFELDNWLQAFQKENIDPTFYANRKREYGEILPWSHLDYGVTEDFLIKENQLAHLESTTPNCREKCAACGANCYGEGVCFEKR